MRLNNIPFGHDPPPPRKELANVVQDLIVLDQRAIEQLAERLTRQVIGGGTKSTGDHDKVGSATGPLQHLNHRVEIVANRHMLIDRHTQQCQLLANPMGIRVHSLAACQLVTHGHHFSSHDTSLVPTSLHSCGSYCARSGPIRHGGSLGRPVQPHDGKIDSCRRPKSASRDCVATTALGRSLPLCAPCLV